MVPASDEQAVWGFGALPWRALNQCTPCYCSIDTTVTDLGSTVMEILPPFTFTAADFGATVLGCSKVLILSTVEAVKVSALADFAVMPVNSASIVTGFSASRLVISSNSFPSAPFAAMASTRGSDTPPWV